MLLLQQAQDVGVRLFVVVRDMFIEMRSIFLHLVLHQTQDIGTHRDHKNREANKFEAGGRGVGVWNFLKCGVRNNLWGEEVRGGAAYQPAGGLPAWGGLLTRAVGLLAQGGLLAFEGDHQH